MSRVRVVVNHPDIGGMYGIKRYSLELVRALSNQGVDVASRISWAKEWRLGPVRAGGLFTRRVANYLPVTGNNLVHAATYHVNPHFPEADVVTVHDVMPFSRPELYGMSRDELARNERAISRAMKSAHIVTDSDHTRNEMVRVLGGDSDRITPIHLGLNHDMFYPDPFVGDDTMSAEFQPLLHPKMLNVLVVQNTELRKRVDLVLEAACALPFVNVIRVGHPTATLGMDAAVERIRPPSRRLAREGRLTHVASARDEALRRLYSSVDVVIHPSEEEGFGLPPLEALACGSRVLASNIPCHVEVLGDAARYFELTLDDICNHLSSIWDGSQVIDGNFPSADARIRHARKFTWARTARETMAVYERSRPGSMGHLLDAPELKVVEW